MFRAGSRRVVTFTGGLGAQLLSAALYLDLEESGASLAADLSYFSLAPREATEGSKEVTIWPWMLEEFGFPMTRFSGREGRRVLDDTITDGPRKLQLAVSALQKPHIARAFPLVGSVSDGLLRRASQSVVLHVRRGDYLNVAEYVVPDKDILDVAVQLCGLSRSVLVLSDSPISEQLAVGLSDAYGEVLDGTSLSAIEAHSAMRVARVLVACNSQYSLTAALLRDHGTTIVPTRWTGEGDRDFADVIRGLCSYSVLRSANQRLVDRRTPKEGGR